MSGSYWCTMRSSCRRLDGAIANPTRCGPSPPTLTFFELSFSRCHSSFSWCARVCFARSEWVRTMTSQSKVWLRAAFSRIWIPKPKCRTCQYKLMTSVSAMTCTGACQQQYGFSFYWYLNALRIRNRISSALLRSSEYSLVLGLCVMLVLPVDYSLP